MISTHRGKVKLDNANGTSVIPLTLASVLYIPEWGSSSIVSWRFIAFIVSYDFFFIFIKRIINRIHPN